MLVTQDVLGSISWCWFVGACTQTRGMLCVQSLCGSQATPHGQDCWNSYTFDFGFILGHGISKTFAVATFFAPPPPTPPPPATFKYDPYGIQGLGCKLGSSSVGRVLAFLVQSLQLDPLNFEVFGSIQHPSM